MSDSESWRGGLSGQAPGAYTDWNSYNAGKAVRDANLAELNRQNAPAFVRASGTDWTAPASDSGAASYDVNSGAPFAFHWDAGRKRLALAILLSVLAGPLGLFYASKVGAVVLFAAIFAAGLFGGTPRSHCCVEGRILRRDHMVVFCHQSVQPSCRRD